MTTPDPETLLEAELHRIAPEIELELVARDEDLREEFDIDSMDFLKLVTALGKQLNVPMPETDYHLMGTYQDLLNYLKSKQNI